MRFSFFNILSLYRLCQSKQSKVYLPEAPFPHAEVFYVLRRLPIVNNTLATEDGRGFDRNVPCFLIVVYSYRICDCVLFFQQLVKTGRLKHFPSIHGEWKGDIWKEEAFSHLLLETEKKFPELIYTLFYRFKDGLSSCFKTPCIVFTGHPSLRYGDVVHFIELWGKSSGNTIIFTGMYSC